MLFVEFRFFFFAILVFTVAWLLRNDMSRKGWLLLCSYAFYGAWNWKFLSLIFISTAVDYCVGILLDRTGRQRNRRLLLGISICVNLGLLGFFKYYNFFVESAMGLLEFLGFNASYQTLNVILPVGISFYTFQTMSYTLDIYFGKMKPTRNLLDFALFVAFFPQLVAGPIVRARDFLPQLLSRPVFSSINFRAAFMLFLVGFFKKACVSDNLAPYVDIYFAAPETFDWLSAWIAILLYSVQIYCDFSGYSDMAIAIAAVLGYRLCVNFAHPYMSTGITEFWRRWHISLSSWLRDNLYIPLGGIRHGSNRTTINLMLTMLWHGAAFTFIVWGGLHGLALIVQREWGRLTGGFRLPGLFGTVFGLLLTYWFVNLTWIFFRAPDFGTAWLTVQSYVAFVSHGSLSLPPVLLMIFGVLAVIHYLAYSQAMGRIWERIPAPAFAMSYGVVFQICLALMPTGYRPFIYFQF